MKELTAQGYLVKDLCKTLEVSRSGYHAFCHRGSSQRLEENTRMLQEMEGVFPRVCERGERGQLL